jgi:hypothetical protein
LVSPSSPPSADDDDTTSCGERVTQARAATTAATGSGELEEELLETRTVAVEASASTASKVTGRAAPPEEPWSAFVAERSVAAASSGVRRMRGVALGSSSSKELREIGGFCWERKRLSEKETREFGLSR